MSAQLSISQVPELRRLYYKEEHTMQETAKRLGVSLHAVVYCMRRHNLPRRSQADTNQLRFVRKASSFRKTSLATEYLRQLQIIGAMLYWGEGYKGTPRRASPGIDFANSDSDMVQVFLHFLRTIYRVDEHRLRPYVYCYADQDPQALMLYWSRLTNISLAQFSKPYVRRNYRPNANKMQHGLLHIRYSDKKLLLEIKNLIHSCKTKFLAPVA